MGEVWRARDEKLDRVVALKVLPERLAADPDARAVEREAKAVAALSHPNILASVYDFGQVGGRHYAVMSFSRGNVLREVLAVGSAPARKAIEYGRQVAEEARPPRTPKASFTGIKAQNLFVTATVTSSRSSISASRARRRSP